VVINAETTEEMWTAVDKLAEDGYKTRVIFPPNFLFVDPNDNEPQTLSARDYVVGVHTERIADTMLYNQYTGSGENWTEARKNTCINEVTGALNWWTETYPETDLTFVLHDDTASTTYEPINTSIGQHGNWISDCLDDLGYSGGSHWNQCYDMANDNRDNDGTDWTYLIFIVDSYNDSDGMFPGGYFAYAYLGGPYQVMTYDNDYWGIGNMDIVCAHESGHNFYPLDEYPGSPWTPYSGYLNVYNGNWQGSTPCIMNSSSLQFQAWNSHDNCEYTDEMAGWEDTDADGLQDILDVEPETWLDEYLPDPTEDAVVTYTGTTQVQTFPNENPFGNGNDIHIGHINIVKWKQNPPSGANNATAVDGTFDSGEEDYTFDTFPMDPGENEFRAYCFVKWYTGYNVRDLTAADDFLTYDEDATGVEDLNLALTYRHPGTVFITWEDPNVEYAGFNLYRAVESDGGASHLGFGDVELTLYDVNGRKVADVLKGHFDAGYHDVALEAELPAGVYIYRIKAGVYSAAKKMVVEN
jgi:hypothetical protein